MIWIFLGVCAVLMCASRLWMPEGWGDWDSDGGGDWGFGDGDYSSDGDPCAD